MKFTLIRADEIPPEMTAAAREKLAMLQQLTPEMGAQVEMPKAEMRGFKAALTRLARKHHLTIVCTSDDKNVYIRLAAQSDAGASQVD